MLKIGVVTALLLILGVARQALAQEYFTIRVVDDQTGRGVPLVELKTVNHIRYYTDSNGIVAFHEPGLMDQTVYFSISSHGYEFRADQFGFRGARVKITPGGEQTLKIKRLNIAHRLYRVTGEGIYRDSELVGQQSPLSQPFLNGQVFGSDSVVNTIYKGKIYWFWGDTNRPSYPLGNFHVPGATSLLPSDGGLNPNQGIDLEYFVDGNGFVKPMAQMPGTGPTWINGLVNVLDSNGNEQLFAKYVKVAKPMKIYRRGLARFDDRLGKFVDTLNIPLDAPIVPAGHPFMHRVNGVEYVYFADPVPLIRVRATAESVVDLSSYESFTCVRSLKEKTDGDRGGAYEVERDARGSLVFRWRKNAPAMVGDLTRKLIASKTIKKEELFFSLRDSQTGDPIIVHGGSVNWNPFRKRWVMIFLQSFGQSMLGELWYAEAESPLGPWVYAKKIVSHQKYSFYNPKHHVMLDVDNGRQIFFEGTYTSTFSGNPDKTPRYDYNQMMYRLDLDDKRLQLPAPVYRVQFQDEARGTRVAYSMELADRDADDWDAIAWYAFEHSAPNCLPVYQVAENGKSRFRLEGNDGETIGAQKEAPLFWALPINGEPHGVDEEPHGATEVLYEVRNSNNGEVFYTLELQDTSAAGSSSFESKPFCRVWRNPIQAEVDLQ